MKVTLIWYVEVVTWVLCLPQIKYVLYDIKYMSIPYNCIHKNIWYTFYYNQFFKSFYFMKGTSRQILFQWKNHNNGFLLKVFLTLYKNIPHKLMDWLGDTRVSYFSTLLSHAYKGGRLPLFWAPWRRDPISSI